MNAKTLFTTLAVAAGGLAAAHHINVALSYPQGPEILEEIHYIKNGLAVGVPPYHLTTAEVDHHAIFQLADGDGFQLVGPGGQQETITFDAADFADIGNAEIGDILDVINAKSQLAVAGDPNGYVMLRGVDGGAGSSLELIDGPGAPLSKIGFLDGVLSGSDKIPLELSVPLGDSPISLIGHPYVMFVSATPGSFGLGGKTVPIGLDGSSMVFLDLSLSHPGLRNFRGRLNTTEDSKAQLDPNLIDLVYGSATPSEMYFAYAVFAPDFKTVEYVSNAFTVHIQ